MTVTLLIMGASFSAPIDKKKSKVAKTEVIDSVAIMIEKANMGDAIAQNMVGSWYYYGIDPVAQDYKTALQYWMPWQTWRCATSLVKVQIRIPLWPWACIKLP